MFTEIQSRQLYVVTSTGADVIAPTKIVTGTSGTYPTDLSTKSAGACQLVIGPNGDEMWFNYKGPSDDGVQRTDIIKKGNIISATATAAADLRHTLKRVELVVASSLLTSTNINTTEDYVLNVTIKGYIANGNDSKLFKYAVAHGVSGSAVSDLYKKLAISLAKNFAREEVPLVKIMLKNASTPVEVKANYTLTTSAISGVTATGIYIEEVAQPWRRGAAPQEFVDFDVVPSTVYSSGQDVIWGTVTDVTASNTSNYIPNSKKVADMEWFFHKERGDKYGEVGFPNNIDTTYQVDPSDARGYSFLDIHYYTEGNSMNVGKSEKTITFVYPAASGSAPEATLQKLMGAAATTGQSATAATGLYLFLENSGVDIKTSTNWDPA